MPTFTGSCPQFGFLRYAKPKAISRVLVGVWLSPVEHCVRDAGVAGSNPATPTIILSPFLVNRDSYRDRNVFDPPDPPETRSPAAANCRANRKPGFNNTKNTNATET